ncbi:hypothetical protein Sphch_2398 [Sphingobium chlorophenolicum L-1]|uniref:Helix-turn-helix domain-containing protein n=1 Tax=Sphingobium chlorophenolicum L-1 TaxID=690566 RepID=F6EYA6_SPHCR|nr:helix-turn-helix domain-containing protein [Sphingobium chlorophenolicum]AEG50059.1 hypothetical protein Sphch_2398 [Sphingobium chlorophenolicum L-1]
MEFINVTVTPDSRLSRNDAASFLGLSSKTLANWAFRGLGPRSLKVGGRRFYYLADLEAFVQKGAPQ